MLLKTQGTVKLISAKPVSFVGTEGNTIEYVQARFYDDGGFIYQTTVANDCKEGVLKLEPNAEGTATFEILEDKNSKPKLRLVDFVS